MGAAAGSRKQAGTAGAGAGGKSLPAARIIDILPKSRLCYAPGVGTSGARSGQVSEKQGREQAAEAAGAGRP